MPGRFEGEAARAAQTLAERAYTDQNKSRGLCSVGRCLAILLRSCEMPPRWNIALPCCFSASSSAAPNARGMPQESTFRFATTNQTPWDCASGASGRRNNFLQAHATVFVIFKADIVRSDRAI